MHCMIVAAITLLRGNYRLLCVRWVVLRWVAVNAVIQESAQICLTRGMLGFGCSKYMYYSHYVNHVYIIIIHKSISSKC